MIMTQTSKLQKYIRLAKGLGADDAKIINTGDIFVRNWVFLKCKFGCNEFGQHHTCPPASPSPEETRRVISEYKYALLLHFTRKSRKKDGNEIDWDEYSIASIVFDLERRIFLDGFYKAWGMGSGPCELCRTCAKKCRHPRKARPSMEACGIDVYATAHKAGFPLNVVTHYNQSCDLYGLILID